MKRPRKLNFLNTYKKSSKEIFFYFAINYVLVGLNNDYNISNNQNIAGNILGEAGSVTLLGPDDGKLTAGATVKAAVV